MGTVDMIDGLLAGISKDEISRTPPAHRKRLAQALRRVVDMIDRPQAEPPKEGLLHDLRDGRGAD